MYKAKPLYVVPPDIRYVNALADSGMLTMWGDELVGIGSTHIRQVNQLGCQHMFTWVCDAEVMQGFSQVFNGQFMVEFMERFTSGGSHQGSCGVHTGVHGGG